MDKSTWGSTANTLDYNKTENVVLFLDYFNRKKNRQRPKIDYFISVEDQFSLFKNEKTDVVYSIPIVDEKTAQAVHESLEEYRAGNYVEIDPSDEKQLNRAAGL